MNHRIIPRLDIKGPNLVKGIHLEGLRVLGRPEDFAKHYYCQGADELFFQDVVASLYERNSLHDIITKTAKEIFIPLTVGGGIRSINDIKAVLRAGADKVSLNTAVIKNPQLIKEASRQFGISTIVVSIEAIKNKDGKYFAYTDNGRESTGIDAIQWAKAVEELGAGEIVLTSVDREGTGYGYDIELTKAVAENISIPVIAHGGAGSVEDIKNVIEIGSASAVAVASILHYGVLVTDIKVLEQQSEGNFEFLKKNLAFNKIKPTSLKEIKDYLFTNDIDCRIIDTQFTYNGQTK